MEETTEQVLLFANNLMRVAEKNEEVKGNLRMLDETMENRFLRGVERLTKQDIVSNVDIRQRLKQEAVMGIVRMKQRVWKVNIDGMDWGRLLKCVGSEEVIDRRHRGIPRKC